jgi:hypothetical protein
MAIPMYNTPNAYNVFQMAVEYNQNFPFQGPPKFTQFGIFVMKINLLATLAPRYFYRQIQV